MDQKTDDIVSTYLEMMDHQQEALFDDLDGLSEELLWQRPDEDEWSIGENLD